MGSQITGIVSSFFKECSCSDTLKKALPSPFQRMPTELVTEIISHSLDGGQEKQLIASISKAWRAIILGTPRFWRQVKIVSWNTSDVSLKKLKRVLELSGSITLDIELDWTTFENNRQHLLLEHFRTLADAGIHRWRSLTLTGSTTPHGKPSPLLGIFTGKLSSFRSLSINGGMSPGQQDIFEPIYSLIAETKPKLRSFSCLTSEAPETLTRLPIYHDLKSIVSRAGTITKIRPKFDIPDLHVTNTYPLDAFEAFDLPHTTKFDGIKLDRLSECGLDSVQILKIRYLHCTNNSGSNLPILKLPNLHTLEVRVNLNEDRLLWLLDIEAPNLSDLALISSNLGDSRLTNRTIQNIFTTEKDRIKIWPTRLELGIPLTVASTLQVLKQWPQIQDLTLYWDPKFKWHGKMLTELCNRNRSGNALCPNLLVLRIVMWPDWSQDSIDAWLPAAQQILKARKDVLPLWKITLSDRWGPRVLKRVTIFDVD